MTGPRNTTTFRYKSAAHLERLLQELVPAERANGYVPASSSFPPQLIPRSGASLGQLLRHAKWVSPLRLACASPSVYLHPGPLFSQLLSSPGVGSFSLCANLSLHFRWVFLPIAIKTFSRSEIFQVPLLRILSRSLTLITNSNSLTSPTSRCVT